MAIQTLLIILLITHSITSQPISPKIHKIVNLAERDFSNFNNILSHNGYLYLGGENILLKLNASSYEITDQIRTGPVLDSPKCKYFPTEECIDEKRSQSNYNKLLLIHERENALLTCWTAYQGTCELRSLSNLSQILQNSSIPSVANDPFNSTVAFIASSPASQDLLYIATTYNNNGPYRDDVPAIAGRSLSTSISPRQQQRFMQILNNNQGLKSSKASIEFMSRQLRSFIVNYIGAFSHGIYNYFLSVQHADTAEALRNELLQTKIIRLCRNDLSFIKSYVETQLVCESASGAYFNELVDLKTIRTNSSDVLLVGLFAKGSQKKNHTDTRFIRGQAICVYSLKSVNQVIRENIRRCVQQGNVMRGLNFIKPDQMCIKSKYVVSETSDTDSDDYCSSLDNTLYPIGGKVPIRTKLAFELSQDVPIAFNQLNLASVGNAQENPLNVLSQYNLALLSNDNNILKIFSMNLNENLNGNFMNFYLGESSTVRLNRRSTLANLLITKPRTNLQIDPTTRHMHLIHKNYLYSISINPDSSNTLQLADAAPAADSTDCTALKSCNSCLASKSCTWCGNKCARGSTQSCQITESADKCPYYDVFTNKLLVPYIDISVNSGSNTKTKVQKSSILFYLYDDNADENDYACDIRFSIDESLNVTTRFQRLNQTHAYCQLLNLFSANGALLTYLHKFNGYLETRLAIHNTRRDFYINSVNENTRLIFYKCDLMASNCSACSQLSSQYSCGWCSNTPDDAKCRFKSRVLKSHACFHTDCPGQSLDHVAKFELRTLTPSKLPPSSTGSLLLTIDGDFKSLKLDSIDNITVCDEAFVCEHQIAENRYRDLSEKIYCRCDQALRPAHNTCKVTLNVRGRSYGSESLFIEFVEPVINSVKPSQVIQWSKGVMLTIVGKHLDVGTTRHLTLVDSSASDLQQAGDDAVPCSIVSFTSNEIKCELSERFYLLGKKDLRLTVDTIHSMTTYAAINVNSNPLIMKMNRAETIVEGGMKFELIGYNFDCVQSISCYVAYPNGVVSEPMPVYKRVSNERLIFKFPQLEPSVLLSSGMRLNYQMKIGFLMDGFNKTADELNVVYFKSQFGANAFQIDRVDKLNENVEDESSEAQRLMVVSFASDEDSKYQNDLEIYIKLNSGHKSVLCECEQKFWFNRTFLTCKLEPLSECLGSNAYFKTRILTEAVSTDEDVAVLTLIGNFEIKQRRNFDALASERLRGFLNRMNKALASVEESDDLLKFDYDAIGGTEKNSRIGGFYFNLTMVNRVILIAIAICVCSLLITVFIFYLNKYYKFKNALKNKGDFDKLIIKSCNGTLAPLTEYQLRQIETKINRTELDMCLKMEFLNELNYDLIYQGVPIYQYGPYLMNTLFANANAYATRMLYAAPSETTELSSQQHANNSLFYATIRSQGAFHTLGKQFSGANKSLYEAMSLFNQLIHNKTFLNIFIQTCESEPSFGAHDRNQFSSLLMLSLKDNLSYLYTIIKQHLAESLANRAGSSSSDPDASTSTSMTSAGTLSVAKPLKGKQADSVVEFMLSKFLSMFMYQFVKENCSIELYRLFRVVKHQIESRPCDFLLNKSLFSINEASLLRMGDGFQYAELSINLINSSDLTRVYKCRVLDCDTILQAKEKFLDCLYKNSSYSLRPKINDIDIEFRIRNQMGTVPQQPLNEILMNNYSSIVLKEYDLGTKRYLTIKDYCLYDEAYLYLIYKTNFYESTLNLNRYNPNQLSTMSRQTTTNNNNQLYHLVESLNETPVDMMMSERVVLTKGTLENRKVAKGAEKKKLFGLQAKFKRNKNGSNVSECMNPISNYSNGSVMSSTCSSSSASDSASTCSTAKSFTKIEPNQMNETQLTRLVMSKLQLEPYVQSLFEAILSNVSNLPPIVKHLFDFFDNEIKRNSPNSDAGNSARSMKTNAYFVRFWVNLIRNPQQLFDINKTSLIDSSLMRIAQVLADSCLSNDTTDTIKDSAPSISKLLFQNDVKRYKCMIDAFFGEIESSQPVSDHELHYYLNEYSKCQPNDLNPVQVLVSLYEYYEKFEAQINTTLGQQQCSILLPLHHKLVQIKDLMMSNQLGGTDDATGTTNLV